MNAEEFWKELHSRGFDFFAGVPDSTFEPLYRSIPNTGQIKYIPAVREDVALGIVSSAYFAGYKAGIILQNSGLGNLVNPLTSFSLMYRIPALMLIGWRGYGGPPNDAPEHWIMGTKTPEILDLLDIPHETLEPNNMNKALDYLITKMDETSAPVALLVPAGVIQ